MEEPKSKSKRGAKTAAAAQEDKITLLPLSELHDFPNHPFKVRDDEAMQETAESIRQYGVLAPAIVRPREDGGYEIIAGHRRRHGSELAGLSAMPCIVRRMDDDTATILMVDSNIQRENILPSERAQAYKMKLEAIRRKAGRPAKTEEKADENNSPQVAANFRADDEVAKDAGISGDTVRRYIRLTELTPELQQMVDEKKIGMTPAVEISYLKPEEQQMLLTAIDSEQATPSLSQAQRMKKLSRDGKLNDDSMLDIMMEQKKPEDVSCVLCTEYVKKLGCTALSCPCLAERMEAGTVGYAEAVAELFPYRPRLTARIMRLAESFPGTMWQDDAHRKRMETLRLLLGCRKERDTPEFFAALYLLTSNKELADRTFNCFFRGGIDFRYARRRGISSHDYTLLMAAKSLYCHTAEVTQGDLAEPQIIPDEAFRLLINALLIARFGLDALKITARRGQREYTLRRLIRREAGGNAPSAGLLFPSEGR